MGAATFSRMTADETIFLSLVIFGAGVLLLGALYLLANICCNSCIAICFHDSSAAFKWNTTSGSKGHCCGLGLSFKGRNKVGDNGSVWSYDQAVPTVLVNHYQNSAASVRLNGWLGANDSKAEAGGSEKSDRDLKIDREIRAAAPVNGHLHHHYYYKDVNRSSNHDQVHHSSLYSEGGAARGPPSAPEILLTHASSDLHPGAPNVSLDQPSSSHLVHPRWTRSRPSERYSSLSPPPRGGGVGGGRRLRRRRGLRQGPPRSWSENSSPGGDAAGWEPKVPNAAPDPGMNRRTTGRLVTGNNNSNLVASSTFPANLSSMHGARDVLLPFESFRQVPLYPSPKRKPPLPPPAPPPGATTIKASSNSFSTARNRANNNGHMRTSHLQDRRRSRF